MRSHHLFLLGLLWVLCTLGVAAPMQVSELPEPLKPWADWVLWKHQDRACPHLYNAATRQCLWPGKLRLDLDDAGGGFAYQVTLYRDGAVALPGDARHWPTEVSVEAEPALVVERNGTPALLLQAGEYRIQGRFAWSNLPESLPVPTATGLIALSLHDQDVALPALRKGQLWLSQRSAANAMPDAQAPQDSLRFKVFRRLVDEQPFTIVTHLDLEVAGRQREVLLGRPLLEAFIPLSIDSPLPARLEPDGRLRVQVRPGHWRLEVTARHPGQVQALASFAQASPWPDQETWVFDARHHLRLVEVRGVTQIDPRQVAVPDAWQKLPAYQVSSGDQLTFNTTRRGNPQPEPDNLTLQRRLWLDFDGDGYTVLDDIGGTITHDWRLSVDPELDLGRVLLDGQPQFITRLQPDGPQGVEVRRGQLQLHAESRLTGAINDLPAAGWGRDFQRVQSVLNLPPGWRLLAVSGVDNVPDSWLQRWTLYDFFLVLVAAVAVARLWGWPWAVFTLLALSAVWYEPLAPRMIWLYLIAVAALARVLVQGRAARYLAYARYLGLALLLLLLVPFVVQQARTGMYPQLAKAWITPAQMQRNSESQQNRGFYAKDARQLPAPSIAADVAEFADASVRRTVETTALGKAASGMAQSAPLDQVDPDAIVQTGPGVPGWQWREVRLSWNGPVAAQQRIRLYLLGPWASRTLNFLMIGLVLVLAWRLVEPKRLSPPAASGSAPAKASALSLLLLGFSLPVLLISPNTGHAQMPSAELLQELEQRLTAAADCLPACADIATLDLDIQDSHYEARMRVNAVRDTAIPLPVDSQRFAPLSVTLNGLADYHKLMRNQDGHLWILLPSGQSEVRLRVALPAISEAQIPLPLRPRRVRVEALGWMVEGVGENRVPDARLHLTRKNSESARSPSPDQGMTSLELPTFARVERTLRLGLDWTVENRVLRQSPPGVPLVLHLPLLAGESVLTEGVRVNDDRVTISMAPNQGELRWRSRIEPAERLMLQAADTVQWIETWRVDVGRIWHLEYEGPAPIHHQGDKRQWLPTWQPWPGERVSLTLTRPQGVAGRTLTIDRSQLTLTPGKRATDGRLSFHLRASQGGQHLLQLPKDVELQSVSIDQVAVPLRAEQSVVSVPVVPGEQQLILNWRQMQGMASVWRSPEFSLGVQSVNAHLSAKLAPDRWVLWVQGPSLGPAVLFWSLLLMVVLMAIVLGRVTARYFPKGLMGTLSWLLLGLGLTQVSVLSGLLVIAWFALIYYRERLPMDTTKLKFNLLQVVIVALTLVVVSILFWAVQQGLLGQPEMQIRGFGSSAQHLNWYQDRVDDAYPQALVWSVPMFIYRALMLAWALWLAFALLRWLTWGWQAFSRDGLWRSVELQSISLGRSKAQVKQTTGATRDNSEPSAPPKD